MKAFLYKYTTPLFSMLTSFLVVLLLAAAFLYMEKREVQSRNQVLILQNDSILSENIMLRTTLQQQAGYSQQKERLTMNK